MTFLLFLLILTTRSGAPIEERCPGATEVFSCDFGESWDKNFDGEPDGWVRRKGLGFPHYVTIGIRDDSAAANDRCLQIDLDGGGASIYSPPVPAGSLANYVVEVMASTQGLEHDRAFCTLTLLDKDLKRLEEHASEEIGHSSDWRKLRIGPVSPQSDATALAVIGLHLLPGARADLTGSARFDDVWLGRLPRLALSLGRASHVFAEGEEVTVFCKASGFRANAPWVTLRLEDRSGNALGEVRQELHTRPAPHGGVAGARGASDESLALVGSTEWTVPVAGPGFYRIRVTMDGQADLVHQRAISLAIIEPQPVSPAAEFGWSLPQGDRPLKLDDLNVLLGQAGVGWVKYPLWYDNRTDDARLRELARFTEQLAARGIELVGLLHDPPPTIRAPFDDLRSPAEIFTAAPEVWFPSLESLMGRMATQVRWWQLGRDQDTGFVGYPNLRETMAQIKTQMDRLSFDANLGFGWGWMNELPEAGGDESAWRFLVLSADPPLTGKELKAYLDATGKVPVRRWVALAPLSRERYPPEIRATDLVERIMAAKIHGADAVFIPDPFDRDRGLMNGDGTVGELFLPWRTATRMLGGARDLGSIQLPNGSQNRIFQGEDEAVMVVWNDAPTREVIRLGDDVRQIDLWGQARAAPREAHRQAIDAGAVPAFVTGVDAKITRWRQGFELAVDQIPGASSRRHPNRFRVTNPFGETASGFVELVAPEGWQIVPARTEFHLVGNESLDEPFEIEVPYSVVSGRHLIRADFEIRGERVDRFSVYRYIRVGAGDVYIELVTRLNARGELEVEQHLVNDTQEPVSFRCHLFAPDRRRQTTQVVGLGRGRDANVYRLSNGEELIGKTLWLRAEQIDGSRVLNHRFTARP
jgi:hypothetical protein